MNFVFVDTEYEPGTKKSDELTREFALYRVQGSRICASLQCFTLPELDQWIQKYLPYVKLETNRFTCKEVSSTKWPHPGELEFDSMQPIYDWYFLSQVAQEFSCGSDEDIQALIRRLSKAEKETNQKVKVTLLNQNFQRQYPIFVGEGVQAEQSLFNQLSTKNPFFKQELSEVRRYLSARQYQVYEKYKHSNERTQHRCDWHYQDGRNSMSNHCAHDDVFAEAYGFVGALNDEVAQKEQEMANLQQMQ